MERGKGKPTVYTVAALRSPALTDRRSRRCLETGSLDPPLAALRRFPRSICRRQIKVLKSFSAGRAPVTASGAPAKAQLLWGKEKEPERRSVSPSGRKRMKRRFLRRGGGGGRGGACSPSISPVSHPPANQGTVCRGKARSKGASAVFAVGGNGAQRTLRRAQPGGHVMSRPLRTWKCRWNTLCPACWPMLETTR